MSPHETRIIQLAGSGSSGGGPYTVAPDTPTVGVTRVTDTGSGNSYDLPPAIADTLFETNHTLGSSLTHDLDGNDLTFVGNGGEFIIDGKLTVTGLLDPTGVQFTDGVDQADAGMPNTTIYVTDGTLSGITAGELVFKDGAGAYHAVQGGGDSIYTADGTITSSRTIDGSTAFPGVGSGIMFTNLGTFEIATIFPTGGTGVFKINQSESELAWSNGTEEGGLVSSEAGTKTELYYTSTSGSSADNRLALSAGGIGLSIDATSDLQLNDDAGTSGQVLTSTGPNLPPVWGTPAASGVYIYTFSPGDWTPNGGDMELTVPQATHGLTLAAAYAIDVFENVGAEYVEVGVRKAIDVFTGDVKITVPAGSEFSGSLSIR